MNKHLEIAKQLRADPVIHYNCGQSVLIPYAEEFGLSKEMAMNLTANFNAGLKRSTACGAITAGIIVLGLYGINDPKTINQYYQKFKDHHDNLLDCGPLLRKNAEMGLERKPHCDGLVYETIETVDEIVKERGI